MRHVRLALALAFALVGAAALVGAIAGDSSQPADYPCGTADDTACESTGYADRLCLLDESIYYRQ